MGNRTLQQQATTEQDDQEHYYDQVVEVQECCGFERRRTLRRGLIWQERFMLNCQDLMMFYDWVHDLEEVVKLNARRLPRKKFIDEFNSLKVVDGVGQSNEAEILLSPSEIDDFKANLKSSVLLSYGQALKPPRLKQSKIESILNISGNKVSERNKFTSASMHTPTRSERKRSDIFVQAFRKDSILKQRQRTLRQSYTKSGFRQSIMSFVDDTMSSLFRGQEKQISKHSAQSLQIFVKFSLIMEKHLNSPDNIIHKVIETFQSYIYKKYTLFTSVASSDKNNDVEISEKETYRLEELDQKIKNKVKKERFKVLEDRKSLTADEIQDLTSDIKIFLVLIREMVEDYYKTNEFTYEYINGQQRRSTDMSNPLSDVNTNFLIANEDNLLILVTAIMFKNEKFYDHIFSLFKKFNQERENNFKKIVSKLQNSTPQHFQVKKEYCLNEATLQKFKTSKNQAQGTEDNRSVQVESSQSASLLKKLSTTDLSLKPYGKCLQILQKIGKSRTPTTKMKTIMQCSQKLTQCVSEFYSSNNLLLKNQVLDADQILSIFCYLLSQNSVENLHSHLFIIEHFATENQMISITGYYYSVLTCALEQLENMYSSTIADIEGDKTEMFSTSSKSKNPTVRNHSTMSPPKKKKGKGSFRKA